PESLFRTGLSETGSGPEDAGAPQMEVMVEYAPTVISQGKGGGGASAPLLPTKKAVGATPAAAASGIEDKPPLTIILRAGGREELKLAVPKEVKLATPPLGSNQIVISASGSLNDLLKLLKPPPEAPVTPGAPAPVKAGPPITAGMSLSFQSGPNV